MSKMKILPLKFGVGAKLSALPFDCEIVRSHRKTLALHVTNKRVEVRCPTFVSRYEVAAFIESNRGWIERRLSEESKRNQEVLKIEHGRQIFYRARELTIQFKEGRKERIIVSGSSFIIQGHRLTPAKARLQVEEFLKAKASDYLIPRAMGLAKHLGVDRKIRHIKLRKTKTKWGHCTSLGDLQYNYLIMLAPYSIIDYMITHEICHLVHMDHSKRFWRLVESLCPNHQNYVDWLKEHEHRYWIHA
jgi:predicted metal-dependent hydrolase